jgi:CitMHS family citrate-Mg2+:H+ or citrate-Ca2+:H+ symporter
MIALIGLIMFIVSSYLALSKKMHLMVPFIVVPVIAGLFCGYSFGDIMGFAADGVTGVFNSVMMCIFAVLYFSVLSETGMFDIIVNKLVGITKGNIYIVMVVTVIVAFIGHLDGAFNTTYLIAIPALAPLYKKLNIDRRCLVLLVSLAAAPMTAMAWANPTKMTVYDPSINPVLMASSLYPVVVILLGMAVIYALGCGYYYSKQNASELAALRRDFQEKNESTKVDFSDRPLARPQLFWVNFAIFAVSLLCFMFLTGVKTYLLFMLFSAVTLIVNYHTQKEQNQIVRAHSATMLAPAILFMGIGVMVGILNGTGMVTAMVDAVLSIVPESMARYTHILYFIIIIPLEIFIPYQAFQSMNPLLLGIGAGCGLNGYQVLTPSCISYLNPCSPLVAATNMACELAEVDIIKQAKYSVIPCFVFNTIGVLLCVAMGIA